MALGLLLLKNQAKAATGIYKTINFQGKVVNSDGTNVADGDYDFVFSLYTVDTAGSAVWTESRTTVNQVTVTDGVFRVALGEVTTLPGSIDFNTDNIYLGINFNSDGEMTPRVRFTAVPYAFNALKVAGLTVTDTTGTLTVPDASTIAFSGAFDTTFTTTNTTTVTLPTTGTLATLAGTETFTNKTIGSTGLTFSGATTDITTGTNEHFVISPNGTGNVGIGSTTPTQFFEVQKDTNGYAAMLIDNETNDTLAASGYFFENSTRGGGFGLYSDNFTGGGGLSHLAGRMATAGYNGLEPLGIDLIANHASGDIRLFTGGIATSNERMRIDSAGNVGIGTTTTSSYKLDVTGTIRATGSVLSSDIDADTAGALTIGNTTATAVSICNSAACDTISIGNNADADTITIGDSPDGLTISSSGFNLTSGGAISGISTFASSGDWTWSATTPTLTLNSSETLTITDGTDSFVVNTASSLFSLSDGSNSFTFDADTGPNYTGTARPTKKIVISPEYAGGTLTTFYGAGTDASITGVMTADAETTATDSLRTYYEWSSSQGSLNYYTVVVRITLPEDFSAWAPSNALQVDFTTESTNSANNLLSAYVYLSSDSTTAVASDVSNAAAGAETWEQITVDDSVLDDAAAPEWDAAGETALIYLRMGSTGNNFARVGDITLNYVARF